MYKLCFYVPKSDAERVKAALFAEGAGKVGYYQQCCFEVEGIGQFMPADGATPYEGEVHQLTRVVEVKIDMVVEKSCINSVLEALIAHHPYEEPAYQVWPVLHLKDLAN